MPHSSRSIRRLYFTDLQQAKTCSKKNLSLRHILDILLKVRKFQAQYPCKVYFYMKREISATNHVVCNVFVLIALAASGLEKEIGSFSFLTGETFNGRTNCENFCGAKGYELVNLSHGDFAESKESCTALLNIHLHCVPVIIQCFMIIAH